MNIQSEGNSNSMTTSMILRAGLPESLRRLLKQMSSQENENMDWPWQIAAQHRFHPVFDAGVERLMWVANCGSEEHLSSSELWKNSEPEYAKEHYSTNAGIESMLSCIRHADKDATKYTY